MNRLKKVLALTGVFSLLFSNVDAQKGAIIYSTYCAGCHGAQLQGASATPLIKTDWKYGRGRGAIPRNIKFGIPSTDMIAWGKVLKDDEVKAVAEFVIASQSVPPEARRPIPENLNTKEYKIKVEQVITEGLQTPWGIEFVDTNHALITERRGAIRWMVNGRLDEKPIAGVPATAFQLTTGGYFDIALDPNYKSNGWVYIAFSHTNGDPGDKNANSMTKVVRGKIKDYQWTDQQTLFEVPDSLKVIGGNR